jgi:hypothetical protein
MRADVLHLTGEVEKNISPEGKVEAGDWMLEVKGRRLKAEG